MKVTLTIYAMGLGGAERVMSILANYWVERAWDITLITLVDRSVPPFYPLDPRIKLQQLGVAGSSANALVASVNIWHRVKILRSAIVASQPDLVISFMGTAGVLTLLACRNTSIPVIVSKHIYPPLSRSSRIWQLLIKFTYRSADLVTVLTESALSSFPTAQGYLSMVMPNPVIVPLPDVETQRLFTSPTLIAVGRLVPEKGFDLLIQAFDLLRDKYPDWQLTILGEGSSRSQLEALISELKLTDRIHLLGQVENVNAYLYQADIFVLSSRTEGFPMGLCEAMVCGLPVIATDCLSGPREIINDGVDGILVASEDVDALANGLDLLMSDPVKRQQLAQAAPQILDRFGIEKVMEMWDKVIDLVLESRRNSSL